MMATMGERWWRWIMKLANGNNENETNCEIQKRGRADVDAMRTRSAQCRCSDGGTLILIINWNLRLSVYAQTASYVEQRASVSLSLYVVFGIVNGLSPLSSSDENGIISFLLNTFSLCKSVTDNTFASVMHSNFDGHNEEPKVICLIINQQQQRERSSNSNGINEVGRAERMKKKQKGDCCRLLCWKVNKGVARTLATLIDYILYDRDKSRHFLILSPTRVLALAIEMEWRKKSWNVRSGQQTVCSGRPMRPIKMNDSTN